MPAPGEALWLVEDTELELAWQAWQDDTCGGCGQPMSESFHPDNAGRYRAHKIRCHSCAVKDAATKDDGSGRSIDTSGLYVSTTYES